MRRYPTCLLALLTLLLLTAKASLAQRGHTLRIVTTDSAGMYLYQGGALQNQQPKREVSIDGLRHSTVDVEVAPAADETAAIRMRIVLGDSTAPRATRFYATTYELVQAGDGGYELRILSHDPLFRQPAAETGKIRVLEGRSPESMAVER